MPTQPNFNANNNLKNDKSDNRNSSVESGAQQERDMTKGNQSEKQQRADNPSRPNPSKDAGRTDDYRSPQQRKP